MINTAKNLYAKLTKKNVLQFPETKKSKRPKLVQRTKVIVVDFQEKKWIEAFEVENEFEQLVAEPITRRR